MLTPAAVHHVHDAETPPDDERTTEQSFDLLRGGVGCHIEVFGPQTDQQVAHRTAHHIRLKTRLLQGAHHVDGTVVHQAGVDAVHRHRDFHPFAELGLAARCSGGFAQQFIDKFFDQVLVPNSPARGSGEELEYAPSTLLGQCAQARIGVGGHGHIGLFHQRHVVDGV